MHILPLICVIACATDLMEPWLVMSAKQRITGNAFRIAPQPDWQIDNKSIYTRKNKTRTVPFIQACLI